ncbi:YkgJ family cysteine cluster protein [Nannocystis pusilla]|uniref:YkgJ family cysteine cluster protein n=1 Tax=Nannocystis pusilla TaxID=889268 RepID=UPI003DA223B1
MVLALFKRLLGRRPKMPRDQITRIPRAVRKATEPQVAAIQAALDEIAALPGLADIALNKRAPKGFYAAAARFVAAYDAYVEAVAKHMNLGAAARPGTPEGFRCCYEQPVGVSGVEALLIYRTIRPWRDFADVAKRLAELGEAQFKEIQQRHTGKDPEKIAMTDAAVEDGRVAFARRGELCPLLDPQTHRCRVWDVRPNVCRMHFVVSDPTGSDAREPGFDKVAARNIRLPVRQQVALMQIEKRMMLGVAPFLNAGQLQMLQFCEGQTIPEVGETPPRFAADGQPAPKANRNNPAAKKFQKERAREQRRAAHKKK